MPVCLLTQITLTPVATSTLLYICILDLLPTEPIGTGMECALHLELPVVLIV